MKGHSYFISLRNSAPSPAFLSDAARWSVVVLTLSCEVGQTTCVGGDEKPGVTRGLKALQSGLYACLVNRLLITPVIHLVSSPRWRGVA